MKYRQGHPPKKRPARPSLSDKLLLWFSTGKIIDGLWVGTMESAPRPGLRRVEEALSLLKRFSPIHYSRVIHHLERVWVELAPNAFGCYKQSIEACVLDERFLLAETTTLERIASTIVHEATHARLEHWGISYEEKMRPRIEGICLRRELALAIKLPDSAQLQDEIGRSLEFYGPDTEYFSNASFRDRSNQEGIDTLRYLGTPEWLISPFQNDGHTGFYPPPRGLYVCCRERCPSLDLRRQRLTRAGGTNQKDRRSSLATRDSNESKGSRRGCPSTPAPPEGWGFCFLGRSW